MTDSVPMTESDLGKWPRLLVVGDRVTHEQAAEIILRTTGISYLHCNDGEWNRTVANILGLELEEGWNWPTHESARALSDEVRSLRVPYLYNHRISSSWIGGPQGWIDWAGNVGCDGQHGLGDKWPSHAEIDRELAEIAQAFPYLRMIVQLLSEDTEEVAGNWSVEGGSAIRLTLGEPVKPRREMDVVTAVSTLFFPGRERGVSPGHLAWSVQQTRRSLAERASQGA